MALLPEETPTPKAVFRGRRRARFSRTAQARFPPAPKWNFFTPCALCFQGEFALKTAAQIEERKRDAAAAMAEYLAQQKAIDQRTKRLRALRLAAEKRSRTAQREKAVG
jgi:hypothetical protein